MLLRLCTRFHDCTDDLQVTVKNVFQFYAHLTASAQDTDLNKSAAMSERSDVACKVGLANEIDDDINASTIGFGCDDFSKILRLVINGNIRA